VISGTEGYAREAAQLIARYENVPLERKHRDVIHLIAGVPRSVLDIGAGSGADAAWYASLGHRVVAVEPVDELRQAAVTLHPSPSIEWLNDSLPDLAATLAAGRHFDLVTLTAVWMHLDERERRHAMPRVASLMREGGVLIIVLRHGPFPPGRRMFDVSAQETIELAHSQGLEPILNVRTESIGAVNRQAGVQWSRLAFRRTDARRHGLDFEVGTS
jgi:SAM-dependent methyltransferase